MILPGLLLLVALVLALAGAGLYRLGDKISRGIEQNND